VNLLSLAHHFLGKWGQLIAGISFLFLYYCLEVSYCSGGAPIFSEVLFQIFGIQIEGFASYLIFIAFFGAFVFLGTQAIDRFNWILMSGLFISFILLVGLGSREVKLNLLERADWKLSLAATPVLFGAYGYHNLLPSLSTYLKRNVVHLRLSIILGSLFSFIIYSIWQWLVIGTLSLEDIQGADLRGEPVTQTIQNIVGNSWLRRFGEFFGFFALITSFLGVSLSMVDFLADGLKVENKGWTRGGLCLVVFIPPILFASANPGIFIEAIGVAGGFGEAILNGLLPISMVWIGRYLNKLPSTYRLMGGRPLLIALLLMTLLIMGIEANHLFFSRR
jgi:tyrosine-specific transport protein